MRLKSVETTPNPNSIKLNLDEKVAGAVTYTSKDKDDCPKFIATLLNISGVKSVFACNDFLTLNRDPLSDWKVILERATLALQASTDDLTGSSESLDKKTSPRSMHYVRRHKKTARCKFLSRLLRAFPFR